MDIKKTGDTELLSKIYTLLNDKALNVDTEKQVLFDKLKQEAEKRKLL